MIKKRKKSSIPNEDIKAIGVQERVINPISPEVMNDSRYSMNQTMKDIRLEAKFQINESVLKEPRKNEYGTNVS